MIILVIFTVRIQNISGTPLRSPKKFFYKYSSLKSFINLFLPFLSMSADSPTFLVNFMEARICDASAGIDFLIAFRRLT